HAEHPSRLWESTDGGLTWLDVSDLFPSGAGSHDSERHFYDVVTDPLDPLQAYVILSSGVYRWYR
ncbi:MAG: hypothetical protein ABIL09_22830, partial [Gemmatimonadota bacterium]